MYHNFEIIEFNEINFLHALSYKVNGTILDTTKDIKNSNHFKYFFNYLSNEEDNLAAKTILIEYNYFSRSYFTDYLNYYASCYRTHLTTTQRVHFFSCNFVEKHLFDALVCKNHDIWNNYLGYIVVKPLPKGIIGATLLKQFDSKHSRKQSVKRFYMAIKEFPVNIFGRELQIETMPYQEQDSIVGSCATAALWFCFHQLNEIFNSQNLTPSEITIKAGPDENGNPIIPSRGLTLKQILNAIYGIGLIPHVHLLLNAPQNDIQYIQFTKFVLYSYLKMKIPILIGLDVQGKGKHLVTANGYRIDKETLTNADLNFVSDTIDRLYVHDDRIGPFVSVQFNTDNDTELTVITRWEENNESDNFSDKIIGKLDVLIIPLLDNFKVDAKVFYTYEVRYIKSLIEDIFVDNKYFFLNAYIIASNDYKKEILEYLVNKNIPSENFLVLFESLPKYVWIIKLEDHSEKSVEFVFDLVYDPYDYNFKGRPIFSHIYDENFTEFLINNNDNSKIITLNTYFTKPLMHKDFSYFKMFVM